MSSRIQNNSFKEAQRTENYLDSSNLQEQRSEAQEIFKQIIGEAEQWKKGLGIGDDDIGASTDFYESDVSESDANATTPPPIHEGIEESPDVYFEGNVNFDGETTWQWFCRMLREIFSRHSHRGPEITFP